MYNSGKVSGRFVFWNRIHHVDLVSCQGDPLAGVLELPNPKRCRPEMYGKSYEKHIELYVIRFFSVSMFFVFMVWKYMKIYEHLDGTSSSFGELWSDFCRVTFGSGDPGNFSSSWWNASTIESCYTKNVQLYTFQRSCEIISVKHHLDGVDVWDTLTPWGGVIGTLRSGLLRSSVGSLTQKWPCDS